MEVISIKIPTNLNKLLDKISKKEDRSKSSLIRIVLQEYIESKIDNFIGDRAYNNWLQNNKKTISLEEIIQEDNIDLEN